MLPLIAFDLDGTLVNSRLDLAESANELLARYSAPPIPVEDVTRMVGGGARLLVERVVERAGLGEVPPGALDAFLEIYDRRLLLNTQPYPGIDQLLSGLAGRAVLAVLTNKPQNLSEKLLVGLGLSAGFAWIVGGDTAFGRKPDPRGLRHLMSLAEVSSERTALVGDSVVDVETAREADATACLVTYGFGPVPEPEDLPKNSLSADSVHDLRVSLDRFLRGVGKPI